MRKEFLANNWKAFPAMPPTSSLPQGTSFKSGRITAIRSKQEIFIGADSLAYNEEWTLVPAQRPLKGMEIFSVLKEGDLVAFCENQIWLLVPQQRELRLKVQAPEKKLLKDYSDFLGQVRKFFSEQGFLEAHTPGLVVCPGTEPYLDVFTSEFRLGKKHLSLYLPTSPELHLKKMLALDYGPLFEIKNCFRNGEISDHHEPEFVMLEWYRPFDNLDSIAKDVEKLIQFFRSNESTKVKSVSMSELFLQYLNFVLTPKTTRLELLQLAKTNNVGVSENDSIDDIFNQIFLEKIESTMPTEMPLLVRDYPPYLAAYSRLTGEGWADRFEIYWQGLELANAFHEINDPVLQMERMKLDLDKKEKTGRTTLPLDEEFLQALEAGIPPTGGIALGLDRLFMILNRTKKIQDIKVFPYKRLV